MAISLADFVNLNPTPMMAGIVRVITNTSVFLRRMKFITTDGFAYRYNREQALGGIAFRALNGYYNPTGKDDSIINPLVESLAIFGGTVKSDRQLVKVKGDAVRASKISAKVHKASLFYDANCIYGDPGVNPMAFYGLKPRITGKQLLSPGPNGGPITVDLVVALQDAVVGTNANKTLIMNKATRRALSSAVRADARGMQFVEASGTQAAMFNGSDIEVLDEDGDEQAILTSTEVLGNNNACASIYCVNFGQDFDEQNVQGLVGNGLIEHVAYGERSGVYEDLVEGMMAMGVFHPRAAARLQGVTITLPATG